MSAPPGAMTVFGAGRVQRVVNRAIIRVAGDDSLGGLVSCCKPDWPRSFAIDPFTFTGAH
jgi:hypothetical protein